MSRITNDLARYRRRVLLAAAPQREVPAPTAEAVAQFAARLEGVDPRGYVDFSPAPAKGDARAK